MTDKAGSSSNEAMKTNESRVATECRSGRNVRECRRRHDRTKRWLSAAVTAGITLAPGLVHGVNVPKPVKLELEDPASGRVESDETDGAEDLRTLLCAAVGGESTVAIRMAANSGEFTWTIKQGESPVDTGILNSENGWASKRGNLGQGLYTLEVVKLGDAANEGGFNRTIDFASGIDAEDVESVRKSQNALTLYGAKDYTGLMNALEPVDTRANGIPEQMRESLAWARIESMIHLRKFEDIFPAIAAFRSDHPESGFADAVRECELAALFERGQKKFLESVRFDNEKSSEREAEGRTNLEQFLEHADSHASSGYAVLPKRDLQKEVWTARLILGEEDQLLGEIPTGKAATRERFLLHCALLCPEIRPDQPDENIERMQDFLEAYPSSPVGPRIKLELGSVGLHEGIQLTKDDDPIAAARYFEIAREKLSKVVVDEEAGIDSTDVGDAWEGMLRSYYLQHDYRKLMEWSERIISLAEVGDNRWRQANLFKCVVLLSESRLGEAEAILDELIAFGFEGNPSNDGRTAAALEWRIHVARRLGDEEAIQRLLSWFSNSDCEDSVKREFSPFVPRSVVMRRQVEAATGEF